MTNAPIELSSKYARTSMPLTKFCQSTRDRSLRFDVEKAESYVTQVLIFTLDRLLGTTLANHRVLILVDVEGAEYAMLQGAMSTLAHQPRPTWMVEISVVH
jgi:FkbM family methyltransferase